MNLHQRSENCNSDILAMPYRGFSGAWLRAAITKLLMISTLLPALAGNVITVDSSNNSGAGSLRVAISNLASSGDTIRFSPLLFGDTIKLTSEIIIDKNLTITGLGDDSTFISGGNNTRIFKINADDTVRIENLTLTEGMAADSGGAIFNHGMLTLVHCIIKNNSAKFGGGVYNYSDVSLTNCVVKDNSASTGEGAGIYSASGNLSVSICNFENNTSVSGGGAIASAGFCVLGNSTVMDNFSNRGGGILSHGALFINNSTISSNNANFGDGGGLLNLGTGRCTQCIIEDNRVNNAAYSGGGVFSSSTSFQLIASRVSDNASNGGSGGIHNEGLLTIISSTVSNNTANLSGGGIGNNGQLTVNNSTMGGNSAGSSGGGIQNNGELSINNSTMSGNEAITSGGAIENTQKTTLSRCTMAFNDAGANGGGISTSNSLLFSNTIIGNNTAAQGDEIYKAAGMVTSLGYNLVRDIAQSGFNPGAGDILGTTANPKDPLLDVLQNNGGTTLTHLPLCGSPAIDAGDSTGALSTDQRDSARIYGADIDIGSVESHTQPIDLDAAINHATPGNDDGSIELIISGGTEPYYIDWFNGDSVYLITGLAAGSYPVTVEDFYGCTASASFEVEDPNGIRSVDESVFTVYPNPASESIFVTSKTESFLSIKIFDCDGKMLKTVLRNHSAAMPIAISVSALAPGNYLLLLQDENGKALGRKRFSVAR